MKNKQEQRRRSKGGRLALRILLILLISLLIGYSVYSLNARRVMRNALPMPFGVGSAVVLSGSMEPALSVNDLVLVKAAPDYEVGDVVVYQSGGELIIHRIIEKEGETFVTRGDANNTADSPIGLSAIKGRMILSVPYVGLPIRLLQTTPGKLLLLALAILLLHRSWTREKDEDDEELNRIKAEIRRLKDQQLSGPAQAASPAEARTDPEPAAEASPACPPERSEAESKDPS